MFVRMFLSAANPDDLDEIRRMFDEDVKPTLERQPGCRGVSLLVGTERNAGGLVEGAAVSEWESRDALDTALDRREVQESIVRVRGLLRQEPVTKTFEVLSE